MLVNFNVFYSRFSVRKPINLLSPKPIESNSVFFPKNFTYHNFNYHSEKYFPSRLDSYLKDVALNKKVFVYIPLDYIEPDGSYTIKIKNPSLLYRKWLSENRTKFRAFDPESFIPKDQFSAKVVDYNLLHNRYRYTAVPINTYYRFKNIYKTLYSTVAKFTQLDPESKQFFRINIPNILPSYQMLNRLFDLKELKYIKVVRDSDLMNIIEFMKWILRDSHTFNLPSVFEAIDEKASENIIVEFYYKGYSVFTPLNLIDGLRQESKIDSSIKMTDDKVIRFIYRFIRNFQANVTAILMKESSVESVEKTNEPQGSSKDNNSEENTQDSDSEEDEISEEDDYQNFADDNDELEKEDNFNNVYGIKPNSNKTNDSNDLYSKLSSVKDKDEDILNKVVNIDDELLQDDSDELNVIDEEFAKALSEEEKQNRNELVQKVTIKDIFEKDKDKAIELLVDKDPHIANEEKMQTYFKAGILSNPEIRNIKKLLQDRHNLKAPYTNEALDTFRVVKKEDKVIEPNIRELPIDTPLIEESLKKQTISAFNKKYNTELIKKDIVSCVSSIERAGVILKSYEIEDQISALGQYEVHKVVLKPIKGNESTIYMRLPKINEEGEFMSSGVKLIMRKQRSDLPIRKIAPDRVALTSYYGKLFIERTSRKQYNYHTSIIETIKKQYIQAKGSEPLMDELLEVVVSNNFNNHNTEPAIVSALKQNFSKIRTPNYTIILNIDELLNHIKKEDVAKVNKDGYYCVGYNKDKEIVVCDRNDLFYTYTTNGYNLIGEAKELFGILRDTLPNTFTETNILGKPIPLGVLLSYYIGFSNLVKLLKVKFDIIEVNKRREIQPNEAFIRFNNYKFIYDKTNREASMLLAGFDFFKNYVKEYEIEAFDHKDVYYNVLSERGLTNLHLNEFETLRELFLDPITIDVLKDMNEPYEFLKLLLRANQLLVDYKHPDINDANYARIKSTERVAGLMYRELAMSLRDYRNKKGNKSKIELDPYGVWNAIIKDNAVKITEDINPIVDLKEMEAVTYAGSDGLSKENVPVKLREFSKADMGLISEATVDSSDVAVNTFLTPDAKFKDIRGLVDKDNTEYKEHPEKLLSTSALLAPFAHHDDPKRVNFINIQNGHTIATEGYEQPRIRTGYEYVVPYRVGELYCVMAPMDGEVLELKKETIKVKYRDGTQRSYIIGLRHGVAEGTTYPHEIVTHLSKGEKFKEGSCICYNTGFFEPDWLDPKRIIYKTNRVIKVALTETNDVFEDSCGISSELSRSFKTKVVKVKSFIIDFNKNIINLKEVGSHLEPNDILFTILEETADYENLDKDAVELLQRLANISPKSKYKGILQRIELRYNGDKQDMSKTLRALADRLDKEIYERTKGTSHEIKNCRVDSEYRVEGKNLQLDTLELKLFIELELQTGIGDKIVFASQLKSVVGNVMSEKLYDEDGNQIDAVFGFRGIYNRVTISPILMGTTNVLLSKFDELVTQAYFNN